jgi:SAM-dependent methyltransferase
MITLNPWSVVPASDYEAHMGPQGVDQLAPLSQIFQEAYVATQPDRVLLLGCATGNGLEHVDPNVTKRIVGVDLNLQYLGIARQRFFHLGPRLELFNAAFDGFRSPPGAFDLVHAALVFEYVHPEPLVRKVAGWLAERGTCSVVARSMRLVNPEELTRIFEAYKLPRRRSKVVALKHGKSFWVGHFGK